MGYELRVTSYEFRVAGYGLRDTGCELRVYKRPMEDGGPLRYEDGGQKVSAFFPIAFSIANICS